MASDGTAPEGPQSGGSGALHAGAGAREVLPEGITAKDAAFAQDMPEDSAELLRDFEHLSEHIKTEADAHVSKMNEMEDESATIEKQRCRRLVSDLKDAETARHRERLHEISDLAEHCIAAAQQQVHTIADRFEPEQQELQ